MYKLTARAVYSYPCASCRVAHSNAKFHRAIHIVKCKSLCTWWNMLPQCMCECRSSVTFSDLLAHCVLYLCSFVVTFLCLSILFVCWMQSVVSVKTEWIRAFVLFDGMTTILQTSFRFLFFIHLMTYLRFIYSIVMSNITSVYFHFVVNGLLNSNYYLFIFLFTFFLLYF